jgi:hypothetical protein
MGRGVVWSLIISGLVWQGFVAMRVIAAWQSWRLFLSRAVYLSVLLFLDSKVTARERLNQSKGDRYKMEAGMPTFSAAFGYSLENFAHLRKKSVLFSKSNF